MYHLVFIKSHFAEHYLVFAFCRNYIWLDLGFSEHFHVAPSSWTCLEFKVGVKETLRQFGNWEAETGQVKTSRAALYQS